VGADIVQECLFALIQLCTLPETAEILRHSALGTDLWTPAILYGAPEVRDEKWDDVYSLCCQLNTAMLKAQKFYYLEEALNFWGIHGEPMIIKIFALTDLIHRCYLQSPEQIFHNLRQLLAFNVTILHAISEMVPYFQQWRLQQPNIIFRLMVSAAAAGLIWSKQIV
jgi:hypothetical protein